MDQQPYQQYQQYQQPPQSQAQTKGQLAVARARNAQDNVVLTITIIIFCFFAASYFIYTTFQEMSTDNAGHHVELSFSDGVIAVLLAIVFMIMGLGMLLGIGMFMVRMMRQQMLGNALQVEYSAYAWLRDWANQVSADLEMPQVEIFITQNPVMNAYAFGFARPYSIVLHSGSIRYLTKDELKVIVVHEMAHIKYRHANANVYLMPFLSIPIISVLGSWISGFWHRRAELTADRLALMYLGDSELVKKSLIKVHVGPDAADSMNEVARQWMQYTAERPMNHFAQTFSDHPFLVRRLSQIDYWKGVVEPQNQPQSVAPAAAQTNVSEPAGSEPATEPTTVEPTSTKKSTRRKSDDTSQNQDETAA